MTRLLFEMCARTSCLIIYSSALEFLPWSQILVFLEHLRRLALVRPEFRVVLCIPCDSWYHHFDPQSNSHALDRQFRLLMQLRHSPVLPLSVFWLESHFLPLDLRHLSIFETPVELTFVSHPASASSSSEFGLQHLWRHQTEGSQWASFLSQLLTRPCSGNSLPPRNLLPSTARFFFADAPRTSFPSSSSSSTVSAHQLCTDHHHHHQSLESTSSSSSSS